MTLSAIGAAMMRPSPSRSSGRYGESKGQHLLRAARRDRNAVNGDAARGRRGKAETSLRDLGAAGPDEPGHADDLACPKRERDVREGAVPSQSLDAQDFPAGRSLRALGKHAFERTADHHADDLRPRHVRGGPRRHMPPVAQDRDRVGDERQFLEPVRDEQDRGSALAQVARNAEELLGLRRGQRRGRFVEDQELRISGQRTSDLDELKFSDGKLGDKRARVDSDADSGQRFARSRDNGPAVDDAKGLRWRRAHGDVLRDVQVRK